MGGDLVYLVAGLCLLLAVVLPVLLQRVAISSPVVLIGVGVALGLSPWDDSLPLDPVENRALIEHVTELTVLFALMGVGLALDRPLRLRDRSSWAAWSPTWRLLLLAMPLCIGAVALLGWALGLTPVLAVLLGAVLAPTDPVLASDVQVSGPGTGRAPQDETDPTAPGGAAVTEDDEVRFALTSEAGLNDGLAFPFVYLAIVMAGAGSFWAKSAVWFSYHLVAKVAIGLAVGVLVGWVLARVAFGSRVQSLRLAERGEPLLALAALLTAYGASEIVHGYGFLAVFSCALTVRAYERDHDYHRAMHDMVERLELLFTLLALLFLGMALGRGLLGDLGPRGILIAVMLVFVIRPLAGWIALSLRPPPADGEGGLAKPERWAVAFLGVRGVGSIYYLAFASGQLETRVLPWLWATVAFTVLLSVVVHGISSTPIMRAIERRSSAASA